MGILVERRLFLGTIAWVENVKMSKLEKGPTEGAGFNEAEKFSQNVPQSVPESIFQNVTEKFVTKMNRKRKRNENLEEENSKIIKACKYCHPDSQDFAKDQWSQNFLWAG